MNYKDLETYYELVTYNEEDNPEYSIINPLNAKVAIIQKPVS